VWCAKQQKYTGIDLRINYGGRLRAKTARPSNSIPPPKKTVASAGYRPAYPLIRAISRGVVTPSLFCAPRMQASRIISGRGWGRHGHVASNARKTS
jgi:hypothetical protein